MNAKKLYWGKDINLSELSAGDEVLLSGEIYLARDAAHKKMFALLDEGKGLPFEIEGACIYYAGPTPTPPGHAVGSCGPTTSGRMDVYSPRLISLGLSGMIGKGERSEAVIDAMKAHGAVYFCAYGGLGALISSCVESMKEIAFLELGCESVKWMIVREMPLIVAIDAHGNNLFKQNREKYRR